MFGLGATELLLVLAVIVLIFGARRLPELGRVLGTTLGGLRRGIEEKESLIDAADKAAAEDVEPLTPKDERRD